MNGDIELLQNDEAWERVKHNSHVTRFGWRYADNRANQGYRKTEYEIWAAAAETESDIIINFTARAVLRATWWIDGPLEDVALRAQARFFFAMAEITRTPDPETSKRMTPRILELARGSENQQAAA